MPPADAQEMNEAPGAAAASMQGVAQAREALRIQLAEAREQLDALAGKLRVIDTELDGIATERRQHQLLLSICGSLDDLAKLGGAQLFWGEDTPAHTAVQHLGRVRRVMEVFGERLQEIEGRRGAVIEAIKQRQHQAGLIEDGLFEAQEEEERLRQEWIIEREISDLPARKAVMPWTRGGEDDWRFRKTLAAALSVCLLFALIVPLIELPKPVTQARIEEPARRVRLLEERRRPPRPLPTREVPPPQQRPQQLAEQKPLPQKAAPVKEAPAPTPSEPADKGLLAFREKFSSLRQASLSPQLGAKARISAANESSAGRSERAMLTKLGPGSSGGINLAGLSRDVGGGGGGVQGVAVSRVASGIAGGAAGANRPVSGNGPGLGRTDEEIQIVFDRYKAALYRLYNKELRNDPTLRGQMVLRLTIEPNGSVSFCQLQSSDMNAPDLSAQVVGRVKTFDFGAKDVAAITIVYPIDFLPAA